jgi:hypothetical protein
LALAVGACGREEADLLVPGLDAGTAMVRDAAPETSIDTMSPAPDALPRDASRPLDAAPCVPGYAAQFNGSTSLSVARPVQDDFTLEAWIKTTNSRNGSMFYHGNGVLYADAPPGPNPAGANDFGTSILNDKFAFGIGNPDFTLSSKTVVTTGEWVHVAATRDKETGVVQVFVDGVGEDAVTTSQKGSLSDQATLSIGVTLNQQNHFIGQMDEVRVWNIARSEAQIAATMFQRLTGNEPGLVAYWRFDDQGGTTVADSSPKKADATIDGTLEWVPSDAPICKP